MQKLFDEFIKQLGAGDKEKCLEMVLEELREERMGIPVLYNEILRPALNSIGDENEAQNIRIWKEHVRSSIVRSIVECCFPYVIKERERQGIARKAAKVVVICPEGEYHEIGARMASDFFTLAGYDSIYVGSSTPKNEFLDVIDELKPRYIAISVTNYYNLVAAKRIIESIRERSVAGVGILAGGHAFARNFGAWREIGADALIDTFEDIRKLGEGC